MTKILLAGQKERCKNHPIDKVILDITFMHMDDSAILRCSECNNKQSIPQFELLNSNYLNASYRDKRLFIEKMGEKYNFPIGSLKGI